MLDESTVSNIINFIDTYNDKVNNIYEEADKELDKRLEAISWKF